MSPEPKLAPQPAKVLLVEYEPLVRMLLADELRQAGLTVVEASGASEALTFLAVDSVDLVVTDIQMPGGMDGIELAERVRQTHPSVPIVLTSGNPPPRNLSRIGPFLMKPYGLSEAVGVVVATLRDVETGEARPE